MKPTTLLFPLIGLLASCSSVDQFKTPLLLGAGGGALGAALSDGEPGMAALGSLAGAAVGLGVDAYQEDGEMTAYHNGYNQARLDRVKRDYWQRKRSQARSPLGDPLTYRYFEIPVPAHHTNGASYEAHTKTIEIVE